MQNRFVVSRTHIAMVALFILLTFGFQNCAGVYFAPHEKIQALSCAPITPEAMDPVLLWDWNTQLQSSSATLTTHNQTMSSPMVADLDGDSIPEVVFTSFGPTVATSNDMLAYYAADYVNNIPVHLRNGVLRIVDGATGRTKASVSDAAIAPQASRSPLLLDLDKDGKIEIVYVHFGNKDLIALNFDGSLRWKFPLPNQVNIDVKGLNSFDIDQDGTPEIGVGSFIISEKNRQPVLKMTLVARNPILMGSQIGISLDGKDMNIVDSETGVYNSNGTLKFPFESAGHLGIGNLVSSSPGLEVAVVTSGVIKIYSASGNRINTIDLNLDQSLKCANSAIGGGAISIDNFDGNTQGKMQMAIATGRYLSIIDSTGKILAKSETQDCSSMRTSLTTFDFNGDKQPEILYADERYFRMYYFKDGKLLEAIRIVNPSGTVVEYPVVADINGDGTSEVLVSANNYALVDPIYYNYDNNPSDFTIALKTTGMRAFSSRNQRWMNTRPIWNQFDYIPGNINDRGQTTVGLKIPGLDLVRRNTIFAGDAEVVCQ